MRRELPDLKDVAARNQKVDKKRVMVVQELHKRLHAVGIVPVRYDLASPFEARPTRTGRKVVTGIANQTR
jgi:hypothetical protein